MMFPHGMTSMYADILAMQLDMLESGKYILIFNPTLERPDEERYAVALVDGAIVKVPDFTWEAVEMKTLKPDLETTYTYEEVSVLIMDDLFKSNEEKVKAMYWDTKEKHVSLIGKLERMMLQDAVKQIFNEAKQAGSCCGDPADCQEHQCGGLNEGTTQPKRDDDWGSED